jgi:hypothetical protein
MLSNIEALTQDWPTIKSMRFDFGDGFVNVIAHHPELLQRLPVEWNQRAISISPLSSPAKAGDPVTPGAAEYWIPRFRGE